MKHSLKTENWKLKTYRYFLSLFRLVIEKMSHYLKTVSLKHSLKIENCKLKIFSYLGHSPADIRALAAKKRINQLSQRSIARYKGQALVKLAALSLVFALILTLAIISPWKNAPYAQAVGTTKYAVNAGGNWSANATWSTVATKDATRVADTVAPTAADDAIVDDYSGSVTVDTVGCLAKSANFTGHTGTLTQTGTNTLTLSGSLTLVAGMTYTPASTSTVAFNSTAAGNTVTSAGKTLGNVTFNGAGGVWTLADALVANATFTLTAGTFNASTFNVTCVNMIASGSTTRVLQYGTANTWTVSGNWNSSGTNQTQTVGTSTVDLTGTGTLVTKGINPDFYTLKCAHSGQITTSSGLLYISNLLYVYSGGTFAIPGNLRIYTTNTDPLVNTGATFTGGGNGGIIYYVSGDTTLAGYNFGSLDVRYVSQTNNYTITLSSDATTTGNIWAYNQTLGKIGTLDTNGHNLSGKNLYTDAASSIGAGNILLKSGTHTFTAGISRTVTSDITDFIDFGTGSISVGGNIDFTGITVTAGTGTQTVTMNTTTGNHIITSAGQSFNNLTVNTAGKTVTLADALVANGDFTLTAGTFNASTFNVTCVNMTASGATTRVLQYGTGNTWTVSGNWDSSGTNQTETPGTSTVDLTGTGSLTTANVIPDFYNLKCAHNGYTTTVSSTMTVSNLLYVYQGGILAVGSHVVTLKRSSGDPLVNTGVTFTGSGILQYQSTASISVAGYDFGHLIIEYLCETNIATFTLSSAVTTTGTIYVLGNVPNKPVTLDTNGFAVSAGSLVIYDNNGPANILLRSGAHVITGNLGASGTLSGTNIIDFGTGSISVGGNIDFTGITVTAGTGTQTVTMNGAAQQNITSAGGHFNNLTIKNTHANGVRPVDTLAVNGNLTVQADGASAVTLDNANNVAIGVTGNLATAGAGAGAKNIKMGTNTWTVGGNVDFTGGTVTKSTSTLLLNSSTAGQTLTSASNQLNNLTVSNTNASGITFADGATATGTFTDTTASSKLTFNAGSAYAFDNVSINGQADGTRIVMASSTPGTEWFFNVSTSQAVSRVDVANSNASGGLTITDPTGSNHNSGGNTNWAFVYPTNPSTTTATVNGTPVTSGTWTNLSGAFDLTFSGALDNGVGAIAGYYVYLGTNASADPIIDGTYQAHSGAIGADQHYNSTIAAPADDGKHFYFIVVTKNTADNVSPAAGTLFDLSSDQITPTSPSVVTGKDSSGGSTTLTINNFYNYPTPYFEWPAVDAPGGAHDNGAVPSGVAGYYLYFGTSCGGGGADPASTRGSLSDTGGGLHYQIGTNVTVPDLSTNNGTYCLRIKTKDVAGNVTDTYEAFAEYKYDATPPNAPSYIAANPAGYTATNSFSFSWPAVSDQASTPMSGLAGYQYERGGSSGDSWSGTQVGTSVAAITAYQGGENTFIVRAIDNAGNTSSTVQTTYYYSANAPTKPTGVTADPTISDTNSFSFNWTAPVHPQAIVDYGYSINAYPTNLNLTWTGLNATSVGPDAFATLQGENTFYIVAKDEGGNYSLDAASVGSVTFNCQTAAPVTPALIAVTDSSNRALDLWALTIKWDAGAGQDPATFSHYSIERSTNGVDFTELATTTSTAYIDATGLDNTTTYYYRIRAVDNAGALSAPSSVISKTPTGKYTSPPTTVSGPGVAVKVSTATITWVSSRSSTSSVRFGVNETDLSRSQIDPIAKTDHSISIDGLIPGTKYYYQIQSLDEYRDYSLESAYSVAYNFTTLAAPAIAKVEVTNITLTAASISWETSTPANLSLNYGTSISYGNGIAESAGSYTTHHSVNLDGLTNDTKYHFKITGSDVDGNALSSDDYIFDTLPMPIISSIEYLPDFTGSAPAMIISWLTNVKTTSSVHYAPANAADSVSLEESQSAMVIEHKITLSNLNENTQYRLVVSGTDQFGNEVKSDTNLFNTPVDKTPPIISDLTIETSNVGLGKEDKAQIAVSWTTNKSASSMVEYGEGVSGDQYTSKTTEDKGLITEHLVIISDLTPKTPYHLHAVSTDKNGNIGKSDDTTTMPGEVQKSILQIILQALQNIFGWLGKL